METRMKAFLALLTTVGLSAGSVAVAAPPYGGSQGQSPIAAGLAAGSMSPSGNGTYSGWVTHGSTPGALKSPKERALLDLWDLWDLRNEGLKLQRADGGQLTPEHYAYLQNKLDAIHAKLR
jgi:hypothetical protein